MAQVGAGGVTMQRNRSLNSNGSHSNASGGAGAGASPFADFDSYQNDRLPPLPAHDFTAGPNDSNQYYRDNVYAGGASSPPQMVQNGLTRGGSLNEQRPRPVSMRSDNPYDGMDDDDAYGNGYGAHGQMAPHHGGAGY